ncbi:MAG: PEP-CTERM sorting domain-containing protein [Thiohalocapsa sp. PB-PSB1]|nr:MAG: PEP-CTERM sorting domain-containing protein [Thiohalocapsa sp. PB-PSB1]
MPEPTSLLLLLAGASGMLLLSRKRTNKLLF